MRRTTFYSFAVLILLAAALLRYHAVSLDRRFHPDEALFSTFARHAAVNGDWMLTGELDKPPLSLYANAMSMTLFAAHVNENDVLDVTIEQGEFAARLPNVFAGIMLVAVIIMLGFSLYQDEWLALWAGIFAALSPLMIAFSASAFTDILMLFFGVLGVWLAVTGRWFTGGIAFGLALATKQQGLLYLPLGIALGWVMNGISWRNLAAVIAPVLAALGAVGVWDSARGGEDSIWALAAAHNTPDERLSLMDGVRRVGWHIPAWLGAPTILFLVLIPISVVWRMARFHNRRALIDAILLAFALIYALIHILFGLNWYDRYALILLPPMVLLATRAGMWMYMIIAARLMPAEALIVAGAVAIALAVSAIEAANFRLGYADSLTSFPDNTGVDEVATFLNDQQVAAVIYDPWSTWLLGYYMGEWSDKRRVYYPDPPSLVSDALMLQECQARFLPVPVGVDALEWLDALESAGFSASLVRQESGWRVYWLTPPPSLDVDGECAASASPG